MIFESRNPFRTLILPPACLLILGFVGLPLTRWHRRLGTALVGASLARDFGIRTKWVDEAAEDACENAYDSARILRAAGIARVARVTGDTHLWRAAHEFEAAGLSIAPAPADVWAPWKIGTMRIVPTVSVPLRSYTVAYGLVGEAVRVVLVTPRLGNTTR